MVVAKCGPASATVVRDQSQVDGRRVTHILDPRTRTSTDTPAGTVTVIDMLAVRADTIDTALTVLGMAEGMALARTLDLAAPLYRAQRCGVQRAGDATLETIAEKR
jgi:thiamine biosynthesis lipoprotein ApbE